MTEQEAIQATRLRDAAYEAMMRGAAKEAREDIEAFMSFDREEALGLLASLGIETGDAEGAEKALMELEELAPDKPYPKYLSLRLAYMKGARASIIAPLEALLEDGRASAQVRERVCNLLGRSCRQLGEAEKAAKYDLEATKLAPELAASEYGNYLYDMHYLPDFSPEQQRTEAARYDTFFGHVKRFRHRRRYGKGPLRVGYISCDFRYHVVLRFVAAMLWGHGRTPFSVYAYMTGKEDGYSEELEKRVDVWRNLRGLSPEEAARVIYEDEIDVLVELGGHTVGNALQILAYKPAPIQVSGIGYWASTGLSAIDYFLGDVYLDDEETQKAFTETLLVLPHTHFCYTEVGEIPLPAEEPPCRRNGAVTFGSFNDFSKLSDEVLRLWARILAKIPASRLLLKGKMFDEEENRAYALARLECFGIPLERVEARGFSFDYLGEYADMDIALDTFPYPGGGTTCDALFMGVPVVTMAGSDHGGRFGKSLLMNLGLGELVANNADEYVEKAAGLAGDEELLLALRKNLRTMMKNSSLMDAERYRGDLAKAYAEIWDKYVREQPVPGMDEFPDCIARMDTFLRAGDVRQALAEADAIWAAEPDDKEVLTRLAETAVQAGDIAFAQDVAARLSAVSEEKGYALYLSAAAAWLGKDAAEAETKIRAALADGTMTEEQRGEASFLQGEMERAKGAFSEAAEAYLAASKTRASAERKAEAYSRYLLCLYLLNKDAAFISDESKAYDLFFGDVSRYIHDPSAEHHDVLRVGYILHGTESRDSVPLIQSLFLHADRSRFSVYGYALETTDYKNRILLMAAAGWRELSGLSAEAAARRIHADEIDILVDLTGHSEGNGLPILAYKPAPVQVSGIQYPKTTGLSAIDYFLTDVHTALRDEENDFTETRIRLPESHICCIEPENARPHVLPAPMLENGYLTFGVLTRWEKATDEAIRAWAEILRRVDGARLLVLDETFSDEARRADALARMGAAGMDTSRVDVVARTEAYLSDYERVDIALDTFPRTGMRSTCEALFAGIPVVARTGRGHAERIGESILANVGLEDLCAADWEAYVENAVRLAEDRERLSELHLTLRRKLRQSAIMDIQRYMNALEEAYGEIFVAWERTADAKTYEENLRRRWERFCRARGENRWADAAAAGSRLASAGVNLTDTLVDVSDSYYKMKDKRHCMYWMSRAEQRKPKGRARLLAWLGVAQADRGFYLTAKKTRQQMLYSLGNMTSARHLCYLVWLQYGQLTFGLGMMEESCHAYGEACRFGDTSAEKAVAYGSILLSYNNLDISSEELFRKSVKYSDFLRDVKRYSHTKRRGHERIRIGYLSPDFRNHVMFHFIWPFLAFRDRNRFEVYAYSSVEEKDTNTGILKSMMDVWRDVEQKKPEEAAKMIFEDEIDILFDLAGHTSGGMLPALAYKPAPIQISGLGYMATTGLDTVDYFLTDAFVDPPGRHDAYFTEKLLYVTTQFCYAAMGTKAYPASTGAPSKKRGWVLFGVFNQYTKIKDDMLLAWKEILSRVPRSRLLLKGGTYSSMEAEEMAYQRMKALGLPMERVMFEPATKEYMERYLDVDIALDTYPWPGGGTTCDTLYMGVPLVSRYSDRRSTRFSYGLLQAVGLGELTAPTVEEYVEKAVALALDEELLDTLHKNLRTMMERSPLMDATRYIREVEAHYEEIWKAWKEGET